MAEGMTQEQIDWQERVNSGTSPTNNEEFDSSLKEGGDPIEFVIGQGQLIPGFENGILGLAPGDKKTIEVSAVEAYGEYRDELLVTTSSLRNSLKRYAPSAAPWATADTPSRLRAGRAKVADF